MSKVSQSGVKSCKGKKSKYLYVNSETLESTRTSDFFFSVGGTSQQGESKLALWLEATGFELSVEARANMR